MSSACKCSTTLPLLIGLHIVIFLTQYKISSGIHYNIGDMELFVFNLQPQHFAVCCQIVTYNAVMALDVYEDREVECDLK